MEEKRQPIAKGWVPLGVGKSVNWILWQNNITLQRKEKKDEQWQVTEEFHIASPVLKELAWRIPHWLTAMEKTD